MEWGICLKKVEKESLLKSFVLFFLSQTLLVSALFFVEYNKEVQTLDETIFSDMRICSFNLQCKDYEIDFVKKQNYELYKLYKNPDELSSYFTIPGSNNNYLKIYLTRDNYAQKIQNIQSKIIKVFFIVEFVVLILSILFSLYALAPFKNALNLTEEFIKDILHDFNTPLSTLRLNVSMLKKEVPKSSKIQRIENSVQSILNLQTNLRAYLHSHQTQKEQLQLKSFLNDRVELLRSNFQTIEFVIKNVDMTLYVNQEAFRRIVDNLLSNAAKYNKANGKVILSLDGNNLVIQDTGKGIKNPKRVFERFYKEQERGIGIGLHIVKKLCDELDIGISLDSKVDEGTTFYLDLSKLTLR